MTVVDDAGPTETPSRPRLRIDGRLVELDPDWLLACSMEPFDLDPSSRQRLYDPCDVVPELDVVAHATVDGAMEVTFTDGRTRRFDLAMLAHRLTGADPEAPPAPLPWTSLPAVPSIEWSDVRAGAARPLRRIVGHLHRLGCIKVVGVPPRDGSVLSVAERFGRVSPTNFGAMFDVESVPRPVDLAYSPVGLSAHTDQPYRTPTPGLQFLHTLCNDAPGGESTVNDGRAAVDELRLADPDGFEALCQLDVEFRYDIGTDAVVNHAPVIDLDRHGALRQLRFSPRLDTPPLADSDVLRAWFRARRWLAEWFDEPDHRVEFKMVAGDVLVVDNHRVLHGRRPFDPSTGRRHLQGCYIDHDGPATMWRLLTRRLGDDEVGT